MYVGIKECTDVSMYARMYVCMYVCMYGRCTADFNIKGSVKRHSRFYNSK